MPIAQVLVVSNYLTRVVAFLAPCAEAARRQNEDLFGDGVDLTHALVVLHHGHGGGANSQRNGTG